MVTVYGVPALPSPYIVECAQLNARRVWIPLALETAITTWVLRFFYNLRSLCLALPHHCRADTGRAGQVEWRIAGRGQSRVRFRLRPRLESGL